MKIFAGISQLNRLLVAFQDKKIVFTNGVFDILHPGHIDLLEFARGRGDCLIVGINTDDSARRLGKGKDRPIFPLVERMEVLAALECVDFVIPFAEDTPLELIKSLYRVDILVKGGDYRPDQVVGRKEVETGGGKLLLFRLQPGYSSTAIIDRIQQSI